MDTKGRRSDQQQTSLGFGKGLGKGFRFRGAIRMTGTAAAAAKSLQSCPTMCDPIDGTRLCHPWDSPGKNTGVGRHLLLQCMKVKSESEVAQSFPTPSDPMDCSLPCVSIWYFSFSF